MGVRSPGPTLSSRSPTPSRAVAELRLRRRLGALIAVVIAGSALAYEPHVERLYRPTSEAPPTAEAAAEAVEELRAAVRDGRADTGWIVDHVEPAQLPRGSRLDYEHRLAAALGPTGSLRAALLHTEGAVATSQGPDYTRVVLEGRPLLSVVVRQSDKGVVIDRFEATTCALCDERARFVRDLIADVRRQGRDAHRLIPGVELQVGDWLGLHPNLLSEKWVGTMQIRNSTSGYLADLLRRARVVDASGDDVSIAYGDGRSDTWQIVYENGWWKVDYTSLPDDSPLRMSFRDLRLWRSRSRVEQASLAQWAPTWTPVNQGAGLQVGDHAVGADFDPADGTILIGGHDLDRFFSGVFRVDPVSRRVTDRWRVPPPGAHALLSPTDWFTQWHMAVSPDGRRVALTRPGKVWVLDLTTGRYNLAFQTNWVSSVDWVQTGEGTESRLVVGKTTGELVMIGRNAMWPAQIRGTPLTVDVQGKEGLAVTVEGRIVPFRFDLVPSLHEPTMVCCEGVSGAAFRGDGSEVLVTCLPTCAVLAERVPRFGTESTLVAGSGVEHDGASWSTDGRHYTTSVSHDAAGVLLWDATQDQPVAVLGDEPVRDVKWSSDGAQLLTIELDGDVWLWDVARMRQLRGL